jgi:hypothetical protein
MSYLTCRWRVGASIGRTIYAVVGNGDRVIGMLDSRELAAEAVRAHNAQIDAEARAGRRLLTGGDEAEHAARSRVLGKTVTSISHEVTHDGELLTIEFADGALSLRAPSIVVTSWDEV